ncbi:type VII secretion target [Nocardia cyriacigeorgica]
MTKELKVEPDALDGWSTTLRQLATDNIQAEKYLREHVELSDDQAGLIFGRVVETIRQVRADLEANYAQLGTLTSQSADELSRSAQMYRTTDHATAAALDRTYPEGK